MSPLFPFHSSYFSNLLLILISFLNLKSMSSRQQSLCRYTLCAPFFA